MKRWLQVRDDPSKFDAQETQELEDVMNNDERSILLEVGGCLDDPNSANLFHKYKISTKLVIWLAYSPDGTIQIDGHCMDYNEHCIRIVMQSLPRAILRYIAGEDAEKSTRTFLDSVACLDQAIHTTKKSDNDVDLDEQYDADAASAMSLMSRFEAFISSVD